MEQTEEIAPVLEAAPPSKETVEYVPPSLSPVNGAVDGTTKDLPTQETDDSKAPATEIAATGTEQEVLIVDAEKRTSTKEALPPIETSKHVNFPTSFPVIQEPQVEEG